MMNSVVHLAKHILLALLYLLALIVGLVLLMANYADLANWALQGLGLQGRASTSGSSSTWTEELVGSMGEVRSKFQEISPDGFSVGKVLVKGELWSAKIWAGHPVLTVGQKVRITHREGLVVEVKPLDKI